MSVKVGIMGYGTIGKRVADAVTLQKDMELVGITGNSYSYRMEIAKNKGYKIFSVKGDDEFKKVCEISSRDCIVPDGTFQNLLDECDVILDCTPKKVPVENKEKYYIPSRKKAIFQGGEKSKVADVSFVAQCNYAKALNKQFIRVVSCNTTGLCRTLNPIKEKYGIDSVHATLVRRAADPWDVESGPINAIVPVLELPSHHGPDVQTVLPDVNIFTTAMSVPTTLMHMHSLTVDMKKEASALDILDLFRATSRVRVVRNMEKITSTAEIMEYAKDLGRSRGDMYEICVWEEGIGVKGKKLFYLQAVHQESDVVIETVDAIRAATGFKDGQKSIEMTNQSMGVDLDK
ncbi:type II glyceraldehyde-3-phosphate dehydrogenase [Candidatus Woesearchaeota archaeon]|nr:type II glyceraldehyde-3-phosphate dehydrogenase [Candidatus Woesearchaeota archaeon]